jgi:dTMP kinase
MKGKLIVIEGGDGSGKTTQAKLLTASLQNQKIPVKYVDFPQYQTFYGQIVARFLRGEFGNIKEVSSYLASLPYALDRLSVKAEMEEFLEKGGYIITNRYVASNMAHQGAKISDQKEKDEYLSWVEKLEYEVNKVPKEDIVVYLYVPWQKAVELTKKKGGPHLTKSVVDIHEEDLSYRQEVEKMYLYLTKKYPHWVMIDSMAESNILPPAVIHQKIITFLKEKGIV